MLTTVSLAVANGQTHFHVTTEYYCWVKFPVKHFWDWLLISSYQHLIETFIATKKNTTTDYKTLLAESSSSSWALVPLLQLLDWMVVNCWVFLEVGTPAKADTQGMLSSKLEPSWNNCWASSFGESSPESLGLSIQFNKSLYPWGIGLVDCEIPPGGSMFLLEPRRASNWWKWGKFLKVLADIEGFGVSLLTPYPLWSNCHQMSLYLSTSAFHLVTTVLAGLEGARPVDWKVFD